MTDVMCYDAPPPNEDQFEHYLKREMLKLKYMAGIIERHEYDGPLPTQLDWFEFFDREAARLMGEAQLVWSSDPNSGGELEDHNDI